MVVAGTKRFTLLPPADAHRMYQPPRGHPAGRYQTKHAAEADAAGSGSSFEVVVDDDAPAVPWVPVDPQPSRWPQIATTLSWFYCGWFATLANRPLC